jgi:hypothetical protein
MQTFNAFLKTQGARYLPLISKPYPSEGLANQKPRRQP